MKEDDVIVETVSTEVYEAQERASIDSQVATAKRFPRDLRKVLDNSIVIACLDKETAEKCRYKKPVGNNKDVSGASVHLARIICQQYGNIRVAQRIKQISDKTVIAEAVAFDMETNYSVCVEARRSIIDSNGMRYSDSLIEVNAMAIMAIAERNAILKVIPASIVDKVYKEAFAFAFGDLTDSTKLLKEREKIFKIFKNDYGITEAEVIGAIGLNTKEAIKAEHIADLRGYLQSLKDRELSLEDFRDKSKKNAKKNAPKQKADLKNRQSNAPEMP